MNPDFDSKDDEINQLNQLGALMAGLYWGAIGGLIVLFSWFLWFSGYWSIHPIQVETPYGPKTALACTQCLKISADGYLLTDGTLKKKISAGQGEETPLREISKAFVTDYWQPESDWEEISGSAIKTPIFHVFQ